VKSPAARTSATQLRDGRSLASRRLGFSHILAVSVAALLPRLTASQDLQAVSVRVLDDSANPVIAAEVVVSEGAPVRSRSFRTNGMGLVRFVRLEGTNTGAEILVRAVGYRPRNTSIAPGFASSDQLTVTLQPAVRSLAGVAVLARVPAIASRPRTGATARVLNEERLGRSSAQQVDEDLALQLSPLADRAFGSDSAGPVESFRVAGMPSELSETSLDGQVLGTSSLPIEGARGIRVQHSTFDASQRGGGAGIVLESRRGGDRLEGSGSLRLDPGFPAGFVDRATQQSYLAGRLRSLSAGIGGPVRSGVAWAHGAFQLSEQPAIVASIDSRPTSSSIAEVLSVSHRDFGWPSFSELARESRTKHLLSGNARLDAIDRAGHDWSLRTVMSAERGALESSSPNAALQTGSVPVRRSRAFTLERSTARDHWANTVALSSSAQSSRSDPRLSPRCHGSCRMAGVNPVE